MIYKIEYFPKLTDFQQRRIRAMTVHIPDTLGSLQCHTYIIKRDLEIAEIDPNFIDRNPEMVEINSKKWAEMWEIALMALDVKFSINGG